MQELLISLLAALQGLLQLHTSQPDAVVSKEPNSPVAELASTSNTIPNLIYKEETYELTLSSGEVVGIKTMSVPYMVYGDEEVRVFEYAAGLRIDHYQYSPSGRYIYFSKGVGKDAGVIPYVFDVNNRTKYKVCLANSIAGGCADPYSGFASQTDVTVSWSNDDLLRIEYDNPGLDTFSSESGPAIGLQVFSGQISETPWILERQ